MRLANAVRSPKHEARALVAIAPFALALAIACSAPEAPEARRCQTAGECDDVNACTVDACEQGTCTHAPAPLDAPCSASGSYCNGTAACVACNRDGQCAGTSPENDCQHPACLNHQCVPWFAPASTATVASPPQVARDCRRVVCDGEGGTTSAVDDDDVPEDANDCTIDACASGTPSNDAKDQGTPCGATPGLVCNAAGQCGCQGDADCVAPATCGGGNPGTPLVCGCTATICETEGATCGTLFDGCGGSLACDDGVKNGGETDLDCGGPSAGCGRRCAIGNACSGDGDCASAHCVGGVCCDTDCTGSCMACTALQKGSGHDGVCGAIALGTDPDNECADQGAATCGTTGVCNGEGACQLFAAGTTCQPASCVDLTTLLPAERCDGSGTCVTAATISCGRYTCSAEWCLSTCTSDSECAFGNYCNPSHACVAKKSQGMVCGEPGRPGTPDGECTSGHCVEGICCEKACLGTCEACWSPTTGVPNGICAPILIGTDPDDECSGSPGWCDGAGACQ